VPRPQVRDLLQRFVNIRRHKIEEGLRLVSQASTIKLTNLSAYEANLIRLNLQGSLNVFLKFSKARGAGWQRGPAGQREPASGRGQQGRVSRAATEEATGRGAPAMHGSARRLQRCVEATRLACAQPAPPRARFYRRSRPQVELMLESQAASMSMPTPGF
jgi:hypothetical protein